MRKRRTDLISVEKVERFRSAFNLTNKGFAELMGISGQQYTNCKNKGGFIAFRFYAACNAVELALVKEALSKIQLIQNLKNDIDLMED